MRWSTGGRFYALALISSLILNLLIMLIANVIAIVKVKSSYFLARWKPESRRMTRGRSASLSNVSNVKAVKLICKYQFFLSSWQKSCSQEWCRHRPTESLIQRFPGCIIRRLSVYTPRERNSKEGPPLFSVDPKPKVSVRLCNLRPESSLPNAFPWWGLSL